MVTDKDQPRGGQRSRRLLDFVNRANLGQDQVIFPPDATGAAVIMREQVVIPSITAPERWDDDMVTLAIDAFPQLRLGGAGPTSSLILLQGVLQFGIGDSQFGVPEDKPTSGFGAENTTPEILFDISAGVVLSVPADGFMALKIRYFIYNSAGDPVAPPGPGQQLGPSFRINSGLAYGRPKTARLTYTDFAVNVEHNTSANFEKPKFAEKVSVSWLQYGTTTPVAGAQTQVGPMQYTFVGYNGALLQSFQIATPAPIPQPEFNWPADAVMLQVTNNDPALDATILRATSTLVL